MKTASWVIREKASGKVLIETFNEGWLRRLNTEKYEAVPILDYLYEVNQKVKEANNQ